MVVKVSEKYLNANVSPFFNNLYNLLTFVGKSFFVNILNKGMCRVLLTFISILIFVLAKFELCIPELTSMTIIALILSLIIARLFLQGKEILLFKNDIPVILLALFYLISMLSCNQHVNILTIYKYILCVVFYIVVRAINIKSQDFCWCIWFVGLIEALFILCHYFVINSSYNDIRIVTHFSNSALAGCLLALSIVAIVSFVKLRTLSERERYFYIFSIVIILSAMVIIDSRASFLALVFALLMININKIRRIVRANKRNIYMLIVATLLGAFLLYYYRTDSVNGRFLIWRIALTSLSENLINGYGVNSFEATYMFNQADFFSNNVGIVYQNVADNVYQAFNLFIKSLYEMGLVGCILLLLTILPIVYSIFSSDQELRYLGILTLMIFIFSFFGYPEDSVILLSIWMILYAISINRLNLILQYDCIKIQVKSKFVSIIIILAVIPLLAWNWWQLHCVENVLKRDEIVMVLGEGAIMDMPEILEIWHRLAFDTYNNVNDAELKSRIISKALYIAPHSDLCVYLGDLCMDDGKYLSAEEYYEMASNMVPALLYPKYKLFKLYEETGQIIKAKELGMQILSMDIKIVNSLVLKIKGEISAKIAIISESPK